jgi:hypothetical protein
MEFSMRVQFTAFLPLVLIAGCASSMDSPSLAIRPVEAAATIDAARPATVATPVAMEEIVPLDAATIARVETNIRASRASIAPFSKALEPARAAVADAAGAAVSSEAWVAAQVAISRLERTREASANALAEVEDVRRALIANGKNYDRDAFAAMQNIVADIDSEQRAQVAALLRGLKSR